MNKNVISQSDELIRLRKSFLRKDALESFFVGLLVVFVWFIYAFMAACGKGYGTLDFYPIGRWTALSGLPYPDMSGRFFDFSSSANVSRFFIVILVMIISIATAVVYYFLHFKKVAKIYKEKYFYLLKEEAKINGIIIDKKKDDVDDEQAVRTLELMNIVSPKKMGSYQVSTPMLSWEGIQYDYIAQGKSRRGFLIMTDLTKARSHGFIQLRTFGEPLIQEYQGLPISKYGLGDAIKLASFICYTSLGQDVYLIIDKKVANSISEFYQFVRSDIICMVIGDKLAIFLDGFTLKLTHPLKDTLPNQILEQEAEAIVALHQGVTSIAVAFEGDASFPKEEKGNGILSY